VYAEDPAQGFIPQAGRLLAYREPVMPGIRIDSGVAWLSTVPVHYDPLLAKLIASGENRSVAIERATAALRDFPILGIRTNIPFLLDVLADARFKSGDVHTRFLDEEGDRLIEAGQKGQPPDEAFAAAIVLLDGPSTATLARMDDEQDAPEDPWSSLHGWRN
jgi:acetyl/propionyl-CoA carboxylase alpha subunit